MAREDVQNQTGVDPGPLEVEEPQEPTPETERPDWLDDRFKQPEDLAKAYKELEGKFTQNQQQYREIERRLQAMEEEPPEPPQQQQDWSNDPLLQQYERAIEMGDVQTQLGIQAYVAQQAAQQQYEAMTKSQGDVDAQSQMFAILAEQQAAQRYGQDWEELKPEIGALLAGHPHFLPDNGDLAQTVEALTMVADMVKARKSPAEPPQDAGRQQKLLAQSMSGSSGRPATQQQVDAADTLQDLMKRVR